MQNETVKLGNGRAKLLITMESKARVNSLSMEKEKI